MRNDGKRKKAWLFKCVNCDVVFSVPAKYKSYEKHWCPVCKEYHEITDANAPR